VFQRYEEARIDFFKSTVIGYANIINQLVPKTSKSIDNLVRELQAIDKNTDIQNVIRLKKKGTAIPGQIVAEELEDKVKQTNKKSVFSIRGFSKAKKVIVLVDYGGECKE
jgi:23S rRNA pseudoU1915 N3-methylase RlmH